LKSRNKKSKRNTGASTNPNTLFDRVFVDFKYSHFVIPSVYFIVMCIVALTNRPIGDYALETDFYWTYAPQAKELLNGNLVIDQFKGPVYQIVLAVFGFLFGMDFYPAGKFLNVLCASITLVFISKIFASIYNMRAAVLIVLLVLVNSFFLKFTYEPGTDMLFLVFYTSAIYFLLKNKTPDPRNYFLAGLLSGMGYLTRYTAISLILTVVIIMTIALIANYRSSEKRTAAGILKPYVYYFIPLITMAVVWGIICLSRTGQFFYNMNYRNTAFTVHKTDQITPDEWTSRYEGSFNSFSDVIFRDFGKFVYKIFVVNFRTYFVDDLNVLLPLYLGILTAAGLLAFIVKFRTHNLVQKFLFLFSFLFYIQILFTFYSERFSLPLLPFYCFLIVKLSDYDFLQRANLNVGRVKLFTLIILFLIGFTFSNSYSYIKDRINLVPVEIIGLSDLAKKTFGNELSGKTIMARKPHIAYYLDMGFEVIPFAGNYQEFQDNLIKSKADYLYISEWECRILSPDLAKIVLNYKNPPPGLETLIYSNYPVAIIYKVIR
jgi:hypothetical protein